MTTLPLVHLWLNRMDTAEEFHAVSARDRPTGHSVDGSVRTYASGRRRAISTAGTKGEVSRTFVDITQTQKDQLITWLGTSVQMRDHRGNKWYGVFFTVAIGEDIRYDLYSATITLETTSTIEGV